jgi:hypothetical protein
LTAGAGGRIVNVDGNNRFAHVFLCDCPLHGFDLKKKICFKTLCACPSRRFLAASATALRTGA